VCGASAMRSGLSFVSCWSESRINSSCGLAFTPDIAHYKTPDPSFERRQHEDGLSRIFDQPATQSQAGSTEFRSRNVRLLLYPPQ
jgi:hypothetical protein